MAITINSVKREFSYNGMTLADPGAQFTPDQVRDMYTAQYPELTTAAVEGPEYKGETSVYKFVRAAGAKGNHA